MNATRRRTTDMESAGAEVTRPRRAAAADERRRIQAARAGRTSR